MPLSLALSIPIGKWSPYLRACLCSIAVQKQPNVHVAILDASEDPRVKEDIAFSGIAPAYERYGKDDGQSAAIDEGWANTQSDLVGWLNVDDFLTTNAISNIYQQFTLNPEIDVLHGQSTLSIDGVIVGLHPAVLPMSTLIERTNNVSQPSCFARRAAVEKIGGIDRSLIYTMDWDLWLRLFQSGAKFQYSDEVFSHVTLAQDTKTAALSIKRVSEFSNILRRSQSRISTFKGVIAMIRQNLGTYRRVSNLAKTDFAQADVNAIPFVNFSMTAQQTLWITFDKNPDLSNITVNVDCDFIQRGNILTCNLKDTASVGETIFVSLETKDEGFAKIVSGGWRPDSR